MNITNETTKLSECENDDSYYLSQDPPLQLLQQ